MLPRQTAEPKAEAKFARRLAYLSTAWIIATIAVGILLVLLAPLMQSGF